jgi:hypothetical protein
MFCFCVDAYIGAGSQSFKQEKIKVGCNSNGAHIAIVIGKR